MSTTKKRLSFLVHASSKAGKTTLAATAPLPIIALDAEGGWQFIGGSPYLTHVYGRPLRVIDWDPRQGPPPRYDGTWEICHVVVQQWDVLQMAYQWLTQAQHDFKSIVVDSITELQRRCKANLAPPTEFKGFDHWGQLLGLMDAVIRGLRDLTIDRYNPIEVAVFIAETRQVNGKWAPYMQGQISTALPYWMDIVGYLFVDREFDANGAPTRAVRRLLVSPHPLYEAGERVQGRLPEVITEPTIFGMIAAVYLEQPNPNGQQPQAVEAPTQ